MKSTIISKDEIILLEFEQQLNGWIENFQQPRVTYAMANWKDLYASPVIALIKTCAEAGDYSPAVQIQLEEYATLLNDMIPRIPVTSQRMVIILEEIRDLVHFTVAPAADDFLRRA